MMHREGRLAEVEVRPVRQKSQPRRTTEIRNWERWLFVAALIAILVLGGIGGLRSLMALIK